MAHTLSGLDADENTARVIAAIPGAPIWAVNRCSNHVGTWSTCSPALASLPVSRVAGTRSPRRNVIQRNEKNRFLVSP
jgi:hypothetical protein